jgi:hypothetical protein
MLCFSVVLPSENLQRIILSEPFQNTVHEHALHVLLNQVTNPTSIECHSFTNQRIGRQRYRCFFRTRWLAL